MKKIPEDIIILHMFTKNDIHMMYGSWDMVRDRQNFWQFWVILCPFTSLTTQKIKISKKWKKCSEISDVIFTFHFRLFLPLLPPPPFLKMKKNPLRYHDFTHFIMILHHFKMWSHDVRFLRYGVSQTDRRTDRQTGFLKTHKMFSKNGLSLREDYIAMLIN